MLVMGGLIGSGMVDPLSVLLWGIGGAWITDMPPAGPNFSNLQKH
jgi:hypothetical protein